MAGSFDVVVIGGGPGGYAAAIRCAQKKASVALVEKGDMGGTCLNSGCIPSKALLGSAHFLTLARHANLMGLEIGGVKPNWAKMQSRKDAIVMGFRKGVTGLVQSNKIKLFEGTGVVAAPGKVRVESQSGALEIAAKSIVLATGSVPIEIPAFAFDRRTIISSAEALSLAAIPESMVIIGGGVIGCEMACIYATVGCKVTIIEALDSLLPNEDAWVGKLIAKELKKLGIQSMVGQKVTAVDVAGGRAKVLLESATVLEAEKVLVAVGRRAVCDKETVDALGLEMNGPAIAVNEKMETNAPGVYAIGDCVGTTYLAHGAFMEAEIAAANACGEDEKMGEYNLVPRAVYTFPEVASVGASEKKCAEMGIETCVGIANFRSNGRSVAHNEGIGEVRVIRNTADDKIMGVTMVGATVTEMIAAARALIGSTEKITDVSFAHPTVSEVLKEAWEDAFGISLHIPPRHS
ncbi:MAG: dihydrolipoyl dehydrogenase [Planctomycetota bacterium]|nr:MAG: dihydrolipoyl dehydrogenase [Planctomycetota bacterium]